MGWTFCCSYKHNGSRLTCDVCGNCPICNPRPMEAVTNGYEPVYYSCREHHLNLDPVEGYTFLRIPVGRCYRTADELLMQVDIARAHATGQVPCVGETVVVDVEQWERHGQRAFVERVDRGFAVVVFADCSKFRLRFWQFTRTAPQVAPTLPLGVLQEAVSA